MDIDSHIKLCMYVFGIGIGFCLLIVHRVRIDLRNALNAYWAYLDNNCYCIQDLLCCIVLYRIEWSITISFLCFLCVYFA